jgi:hypothetical protein
MELTDSAATKFFGKRSITPRHVTRDEFDNFCYTNFFADGPHQSSFGKGYGEPYNPHSCIFGILTDGTGVYSYV